MRKSHEGVEDLSDKIDVLIPVYNSTDDLRRSLTSISMSPARDYCKVIVVDNDSDEDLRHVVDQFDFAIEYRKNESNIGRIPNWNRALTLVTNSWFMFLFAGDELDPDLDIYDVVRSLGNSNHIIFPFNMKENKSNRRVNNFGFNKVEHNLELRLGKFLLDCKMPWGPLQTHIFNASSSTNKFDETNDTHADIEFVFQTLSTTKNVSFYPKPIFTWVWSKKRFHNQIDLHLCVKKDYKFSLNNLDCITENYSRTRLKFNTSLRIIRYVRSYPLTLVLRLIWTIIFLRGGDAD